MKEIYLGDGLYASCDGRELILRAPRPDGDHWVSLERGMFEDLQSFASKWWNTGKGK